MSSSAEPLDWSEFPARDVAVDTDGFYSPGSELAALAKGYDQALREERDRSVETVIAARKTIVRLAVFAGRLDQLLSEALAPMAAQGLQETHDPLRVLKDMILQALREDGVEIRDPVGLPRPEVADWVDVDSWVHRETFEREEVAQTQECAVFQDGVPVHLARVIMGAPLEDDPGQQTTGKDGNA
jgi:hypothetical protein